MAMLGLEVRQTDIPAAALHMLGIATLALSTGSALLLLAATALDVLAVATLALNARDALLSSAALDLSLTLTAATLDLRLTLAAATPLCFGLTATATLSLSLVTTVPTAPMASGLSCSRSGDCQGRDAC
jgi:hypothetical protein